MLYLSRSYYSWYEQMGPLVTDAVNYGADLDANDFNLPIEYVSVCSDEICDWVPMTYEFEYFTGSGDSGNYIITFVDAG